MGSNISMCKRYHIICFYVQRVYKETTAFVGYIINGLRIFTNVSYKMPHKPNRRQNLMRCHEERRRGSIVWQCSDIPDEMGMASPRLQRILWEESLFDLEILFRYRGISTWSDLVNLTEQDQSVLHVKAAKFFKVLDVKIDHIDMELKLTYLFNSDGGKMPNMNTTSLPYLPAPDHATQVQKELDPALHEAIGVIGEQSLGDCKARLQRGNELIKAACLDAGRALKYLVVLEGINEKDRWVLETLKAAKKAVRNVIYWYCVGMVGGLESKLALRSLFEDICNQVGLDALDDMLNAHSNYVGIKGLDLETKRAQYTQMLHAKAAAYAASSSKDEPNDDSEAKRDQLVEREFADIAREMQMGQMNELLHALVQDVKDIKDKLP